ncbi:hypothetical protein JTE90_003846 [Oedothorax gibbosus]|uniref:Uncharacterized protein n=1 Tax=Oedothorax gibbosus TaxID=931172 RepID=A0AAV6TF75_9ARAC|nr:hypothetical protein JTE90_003846 [Oedothorax gibbosus]
MSCSPWRLIADMGVRTARKITISLGFQGPTSARTRKRRGAFTRTAPLSGRADSRDTNYLQRKDKLPGSSVDVFRVRLVTALGPEGNLSSVCPVGREY